MMMCMNGMRDDAGLLTARSNARAPVLIL